MHFGIRINPLECGSVVVLNSSISVVVSRQLYCYVFSLKVFRIITDWNVMKWNKMFWLKTWNTSQLHWNPRIQKIASTCLAVATDQEIAMAIEMDSLTDRNQRKILLSLNLPRLWQWLAELFRAPCFHLTSVLPVFLSVDQVIGPLTGLFTRGYFYRKWANWTRKNANIWLQIVCIIFVLLFSINIVWSILDSHNATKLFLTHCGNQNVTRISDFFTTVTQFKK